MNILDQIKEADGFNSDELEIEEWNFSVKMKEPTSGEMAAARKKYVQLNPDGTANIAKSQTDMLNYSMLFLCIVDENGERVFESAKHASDILSTKSTRIVNKIIKAAGKLCGEDIEEAEKN